MAKPNTRSTLKDIRHEEMFQSKRRQPIETLCIA